MIIEIYHKNYRELFGILGRIVCCRLEIARLKLENRLFKEIEAYEGDNH